LYSNKEFHILFITVKVENSIDMRLQKDCGEII